MEQAGKRVTSRYSESLITLSRQNGQNPCFAVAVCVATRANAGAASHAVNPRDFRAAARNRRQLAIIDAPQRFDRETKLQKNRQLVGAGEGQGGLGQACF